MTASSAWSKASEEELLFQARLRASRDRLAADLGDMADAVQQYQELDPGADLVRV